ncbi:MAG: adenosylcobinamide-GDP ribazoletransferase [Lautropia sp.]|nr:adenosylcobinamide-GDP ribazoletransferase [Lautropia sp.]
MPDLPAHWTFTRRLADAARHLLLSIQYFTRLPLPAPLAHWAGFSPARMKAATAHFPGVGWLVAGFSAVVMALAWHALAADGSASVWGSVVLSIMASVWMTGAIHEDGLADVCDGLGGHADRETALRIMKDARLGSYAVIALVLALLLKVALLAALLAKGLGVAISALLVAHVLSRWAAMWLPQRLPYVGSTQAPRNVDGQGEGSKAHTLVANLPFASFVVSTMWAAPAMGLLAVQQGLTGMLWVLLVMAVLTGLLGRFFRRRLGGITGDCLGTTQQLTELGIYLVLVARIGG